MNERTREIELTVEHPEDDGERADVVLARRVPDLSRRAVKTMGREGRLRLDGRRVPPSETVHKGQRLSLRWTDDPAALPPLELLAETGDFVFVAKPAGVHVHRLRPDQPPALCDAVAAAFPECAEASEDPRERGALHRLDYDTTGVVAFARHREAYLRGRAAFREGRTMKLYLAVCHATHDRWPPAPPPDALPSPRPLPDFDIAIADMVAPAEVTGVELCAPLGPGSARDRMRVRVDGQPSRTLVWPLCRAEAPSPVRCVALQLVTGRRHQARVHLAWCGWPIVGDPLYGGGYGGVRADVPLHLHAFALQLDPSATDPIERGPVVAPPPEHVLEAARACVRPWSPQRA